MWVITVFSGSGILMYEFPTKTEAKERFDVLQGTRILSEIV